LILALLAIAALYDKIMEHSSGPAIESNEPDRRKNFSLFLHIPLLSSAFFYLIHPMIGLLMIFSAAFFSIGLSIRANSIYRNMTLARSLIYYGWSILFAMIPLFIVVSFINIIYSIDILGDL
jgi:hypothetical protein